MIRFGRTIWYTAMSVVAILSTGATALAVPVVPNFTQADDEPARKLTQP